MFAVINELDLSTIEYKVWKILKIKSVWLNMIMKLIELDIMSVCSSICLPVCLSDLSIHTPSTFSQLTSQHPIPADPTHTVSLWHYIDVRLDLSSYRLYYRTSFSVFVKRRVTKLFMDTSNIFYFPFFSSENSVQNVQRVTRVWRPVIGYDMHVIACSTWIVSHVLCVESPCQQGRSFSCATETCFVQCMVALRCNMVEKGRNRNQVHYRSRIWTSLRTFKSEYWLRILRIYMPGSRGMTGDQDPPPPGKSQVAKGFLRNTGTGHLQKSNGPLGFKWFSRDVPSDLCVIR